MKNNKGFTLMELIITISIISMVLAIPLLKGSIITNYREKKELEEFTKDIKYARNKAIIESTRYSVYLRIDKNYYIIYKHIYPIKKIIKKKEFNYGISLISTNIKDNELIFSFSGAPENSGTIKLGDRKGNHIEIRITPATGKVNIYYD